MTLRGTKEGISKINPVGNGACSANSTARWNGHAVAGPLTMQLIHETRFAAPI